MPGEAGRREKTSEGACARWVAQEAKPGGDEAGCMRTGRGSGGDRARREEAELGGGVGHDGVPGCGGGAAIGGSMGRAGPVPEAVVVACMVAV